ncbi:MAG: NADH-quinone oxidoreductase subunit NuoH [Coriobacteriia bacterium]
MSGLARGAIMGLAAGIAIALAALFGVWWERKVSARIQMRFGPQEAGPAGLLQTLADTLKLVLKEDVTPAAADVMLFRMAPLLAFAPVAMSLAVIPLATGWAPLDSSVGLVFFLAVPALSVFGMLFGGWASRNTYATIGALRAAAQMISYEVPRALSVASLAVLAGSLRPTVVVARWTWWWLPLTIVGFVVYLISSVAELNRGPFDIPEAESELVAGYFADYTGIRWAIFMMTEYGGMLAASLFGAAVFLGGYRGLPGIAGVLLMLVKAVVIVTAMMWAKWTLPRMRSDQLMSFAWTVLTPVAIVQLVVVGLVVAWL